MIGEAPEDVLAFFNGFARPVIWTSATTEVPVPIVGIYDEGNEPHDFNTQKSEVMVARPSLRCPTYLASGVKRGDRLEFTDPTGADVAFLATGNPEREADGLTSLIYVRRTT